MDPSIRRCVLARGVKPIPNRLSPRLTRLAAFGIATFALGVSMAGTARADDVAPDADSGPGPSVARVSVADGGVSIFRGDVSDDDDDGFAATPNAPILANDDLSTAQDGRAEVQFDGISMLRVSANTQVRFADLDYGHEEAQLAAGTIELRELNGPDGQPQIDTPSVSVRPLATGRYLVTVLPDGTSEITVRSGQAEILTPAGAQTVVAGESFEARGTPDNPTVQAVALAPRDDFDAFNTVRDRFERPGLADPGYDAAFDGDELDQYGQWVQVPAYGRVWHPYEEAADWAPYRDGSWVWEDAYGWTWVGNEPWGWAPYHYGRWFYDAAYGGWLWTPADYAVSYAGAYGPRLTFWRPALVSFFGFGFGGGSGFSLNAGFGNVCWVPLAPQEAYHPWYGYGNGWHGYGHGNPANVTNVTNVTNINYGTIAKNYRNAGAPGGVSSIDTRRFLEGGYHPASVPVTVLRTAHVGAFHGPLPLAPTQQNLAFGARTPPQGSVFQPLKVGASFAGHPTLVRRYAFSDQRHEIATTLQAHNLPVEPNAFAPAVTATNRTLRLMTGRTANPATATQTEGGLVRGRTGGSLGNVHPITSGPAIAAPPTPTPTEAATEYRPPVRLYTPRPAGNPPADTSGAAGANSQTMPYPQALRTYEPATIVQPLPAVHPIARIRRPTHRPVVRPTPALTRSPI